MARILLADRLSKHFLLPHARTYHLKDRAIALFRGARINPDDLFVALNAVSFSVAEGESVALIGRNGSGKSTLLKLIAGIHHATGGRLLMRAGARIATMIELGVGFHPELTGRENVHLNAAIHGLTSDQIEAIYPLVVEYAELAAFMDSPIRTYSSGMVMRLGFAIAVNLDPDIFLLDEIFAVGDEEFQQKCLASMRRFRERGKTMFFVSHAPEAVREMCTRALLLDRGRLIFDGPTDDAFREYRKLLHGADAPELPRDFAAKDVHAISDMSLEHVALLFASALRRLSPGGSFYVAFYEAPTPVATDPIERGNGIRSYFDRPPRHFDYETLARYARACGGAPERVEGFTSADGQAFMLVRQSDQGQTA